MDSPQEKNWVTLAVMGGLRVLSITRKVSYHWVVLMHESPTQETPLLLPSGQVTLALLLHKTFTNTPQPHPVHLLCHQPNDLYVSFFSLSSSPSLSLDYFRFFFVLTVNLYFVILLCSLSPLTGNKRHCHFLWCSFLCLSLQNRNQQQWW